MKKLTQDPRRHGLAIQYKFVALLVPEGFGLLPRNQHYEW